MRSPAVTRVRDSSETGADGGGEAVGDRAGVVVRRRTPVHAREVGAEATEVNEHPKLADGVHVRSYSCRQTTADARDVS